MRSSPSPFQRRARILFGFLLLVLLLLVGRIGNLQLVRGEEFAERAHRQHFRSVPELAPRGSILDRHGRPIVATYHSRSIAANPQEVEEIPTFAAEVALALREPGEAPRFSAAISRARKEGLQFVYLSRWVDRDRAATVEALHLRGLDIREEPRREYPHGNAAAALVGMVGPVLESPAAGLSGLERRFDVHLRGVEGKRSVFRSGAPGETPYHLFPERDVPAERGRDLHTTIDIAIQQIAEEALAQLDAAHRPKSCCALVMDPRTGDLLAVAGRPLLDPDRFPDVSPEALGIPAIQMTFEPGSTIKPLVMAWALSRGAVHAGQSLDCGPGVKYFGSRALHDVRPNGVLTLEEVLVKSSNIGMAQVGIALGIQPTFDLLDQLGCFRPTGIDLAGEGCGRSAERLERWTVNYMLTTVSMGHAFSVTPIQLLTAFTPLLRDGTIRTPRLLADGEDPAPRTMAFSRHALTFVRDAMVKVVEEGTGRRARVPGVRVGGKTGTSEQYPEGCQRYHSSFIGFAPADDPRLLVLIVTDDPKTENGIRPYGGVVAAPYVGEILRRALPLVPTTLSPTPSESGVRQNHSFAEQVRSAAVHRSSVNAGVRMTSAQGRNPDSEGVRDAGMPAECRSESR